MVNYPLEEKCHLRYFLIPLSFPNPYFVSNKRNKRREIRGKLRSDTQELELPRFHLKPLSFSSTRGGF